MKVLGGKQFDQMKFKFLGLQGKWHGTLGDLTTAFQAVVFGGPGNGKTEFCLQMASMLTEYGKVAWLSYEQGHGADLQRAARRNNLIPNNPRFLPINPLENIPAGVSRIEDLDKFLSRRNSPDFVFIDSTDYTRFKWEDYEFLKLKYGKKKGFVWISHAKGKRPKSSLAEQILYDGGLGLLVHKYIAYVDKNRFGGFDDYIIYEKMAREKNPLYFEQKTLEGGKPKPPKNKLIKEVEKQTKNLFDGQKENEHLHTTEDKP